MAYVRKKARAEAVEVAEPINTLKQYVITDQVFRGQVNNTRWEGKRGDVIEMEPWQADLLQSHIKEL